MKQTGPVGTTTVKTGRGIEIETAENKTEIAEIVIMTETAGTKTGPSVAKGRGRGVVRLPEDDSNNVSIANDNSAWIEFPDHQYQQTISLSNSHDTCDSSVKLVKPEGWTAALSVKSHGEAYVYFGTTVTGTERRLQFPIRRCHCINSRALEKRSRIPDQQEGGTHS